MSQPTPTEQLITDSLVEFQTRMLRYVPTLSGRGLFMGWFKVFLPSFAQRIAERSYLRGRHEAGESREVRTEVYQAGKAAREQEIRKQIGFMRQWLNENRITDKKMVTDGELLSWLSPTPIGSCSCDYIGRGMPFCICGGRPTRSPQQEGAQVLCPIHNNLHYCMYKVPGHSNSACKCVCTCDEAHSNGD